LTLIARRAVRVNALPSISIQVTIHTRPMNPRFFTGMTFAFCGSFSLRTLEAMKVPAPHNEKQSNTIAIFVSKVMDQFQAYRPSFSQQPAPSAGGK